MTAAALVAVLVFGAAPAALAATPTADGLGDSSTGQAGTSDCAAGVALTGIRGDVLVGGWTGTYGGIVGNASALCGTDVGPAIGTASEGNALQDSTCPAGQVVVGLDGYEGDLVDGLWVLCRALDAGGAPTGETTTGASVGGTGGGPSSDILCPSGHIAVGLTGSYETTYGILEYLALNCEGVADTAAPIVVMVEPSKTFQTKTTFGVRWGANEAATFDVRRRTASTASGFGAQSLWRTATTATRGTFTGQQGRTYCFSARGADAAANLSGWTLERCTAVPRDNAALTKSGSWTSQRGTAYFAGTRQISKQKGARLSAANVSTKRIAVLAFQCPGCGTMDVLFKGTRVARFDLDRSTRGRRYFAVPAFNKVRTGTVAIVVRSSGKPVAIDALGLSRK